jgi:uncharacterized membrane-anchored protein
MIRIGVFIVSFFILLYSLGGVIFNKEQVLKNGTAYKLRIAPIDPGDPFRGKYITLNFEANNFPAKPGTKYYTNQTIFVALANNKDGYAVIDDVSLTKPPGKNFVEAKLAYYYEGLSSLRINYPFDKFYMEEDMAPLAETALRFTAADSLRNAYAKVFVKNGEAVIENVYVDEKKLTDYLRLLKK